MSRKPLFLALITITVIFCGLFLYRLAEGQADTPQIAGRPIPVASPVQKCVNLGGALEAPNEGDWGYVINAEDLQLIAKLGFDTVRIPIKWSARSGNYPPYTIPETEFRRIDTVISDAMRAGLNVIIDVHHYDEMNVDPETHLPRLYAIWSQIITRYQNFPNSLIYEFLNEPHSKVTPEMVDKINRDLLKAVRQVNPERWVIMGGADWGTLGGLIKTLPPYDPHAMITFHYYEPFRFTHQGAPWYHENIPLGQNWGTSEERTSIARHFAEAARWRDKMAMPILLGEFGVYTKVDDTERAEWTKYVRKTAETVGFGWCYWDFATSLAMFNPETRTLRAGMQDALLSE